MPSRNFYCIFSDDLASSRDWFVDRLGYRAGFDSDWFVNLQAADNAAVEIAIMDRSHELVPDQFRQAASGGMLTIVVDDVDSVHQAMKARGDHVIEPPRDLFYGQRRMLVQDPNGVLIDVSSQCDPDPDWLASLRQ